MPQENISNFKELSCSLEFWEELDKILQKHKLTAFPDVWEKTKGSPPERVLTSLDDTNDVKLVEMIIRLANGKIPFEDFASVLQKGLKINLKIAKEILKEIDEAVFLLVGAGLEKFCQATSEPKISKAKKDQGELSKEKAKEIAQEDIYREPPE
jgi:hypothetical protein